MIRLQYQRLTTILPFLIQLTWCVPCLAAQETADQPLAFKKLALIPIMEPSRLTVENRGTPLQALGLLGHIANRDIEVDRSRILWAHTRKQGIHFGQDITSALVEELTKAGYSIEVITDIKRAHDDPEEIDYSLIHTDADAIVSATYEDAGLYAGQFSTYFKPRLNLDVDVINVADKEQIKSMSIHYGVDAEKPTEEDIPADPKYAYDTFEKVFEKQGEIAECYRIGIREIAALVARQINQPERQ